MRIDRITLRQIAMPLKSPFVTAQGTESVRQLIIVEARSGDLTGYGEVSALSAPFYTEETHETARLILGSFLVPAALASDWRTPTELSAALAHVRRHPMAKAGLEAAAWDLFAQSRSMSLAEAVGGTKARIESGVVLGIERDLAALVRTVERFLGQGYRRIKLKIEPDWDYEPLRAVRMAFPDAALMADANGSYSPTDMEQLRRLDDLGLLMIEQPFAPVDLVDHAKLQSVLATPICLDESIEGYHDAHQAIELGSCRIINIKPARVGGISEALAIHDLATAHSIPLWCGGMLESGIGRAHCIAVASLPGFTYPADLSGSDRYFQEDVIQPKVEVEEGFIRVPKGIGLGYCVRTDLLEKYTIWSETFE